MDNEEMKYDIIGKIKQHKDGIKSFSNLKKELKTSSFILKKNNKIGDVRAYQLRKYS